jgi:hypothetical protein
MSRSASLLEKWAYVMIIIVCFAILFSILFYFISILYKRIINSRNSNDSDREFINKNTNNTNKSSRDSAIYASSEDCLCHLSASSKDKCAYCVKRAKIESSAYKNNSEGMNRNIVDFNNRHTFDTAGNGFYQDCNDFKAKKFTSLNLAFDPIALNTTTAAMVAKEPPEATGMLAQLINKIKNSLFAEVDNTKPNADELKKSSSEKNITYLEQSEKTGPPSFRRASTVITPSLRKSSIKRNSTVSGTTTSSLSNNRKSSLASNSTTGTIHSVKFKANSIMNKKKRSLKSNGSTSLKGSRDYSSTSEEDSEEMDDHFDVEKDDELFKQQQQRYNNSGILAKRDTLSSLGTSKKNSLANSDYYSSRKSSNSSCMESSVVDLYRQKRFSTDTSSSQFTNSINSGTFNIKPSHLDTSFRVVALEQQPSVNNLSETGIQQKRWNSKKASLSSASSAVSYPETEASRERNTARKYSMASSTSQQQNTANIYDKFWVPPEIAKLAKLDKQRSSLPNTSVPVYDTILEVNEKAVTGSSSHVTNSKLNRSPSPRLPNLFIDNAGNLFYYLTFKS